MTTSPARILVVDDEKLIRWSVGELKKHYFARDPPRPITIWLFKDAASYQANAMQLTGEGTNRRLSIKALPRRSTWGVSRRARLHGSIPSTRNSWQPGPGPRWPIRRHPIMAVR